MTTEQVFGIALVGVVLLGLVTMGGFASVTLGLAMDVKERGPQVPPTLEADYRQVGYERGVDWALLAAWDAVENRFNLPVRSREEIYSDMVSQALAAMRRRAQALCNQHPGDPAFCPPPEPVIDPDYHALLWQASYRTWHAQIVAHIDGIADHIKAELTTFVKDPEAGYRKFLPADKAGRAAELYDGYQVLDQLDQDLDHYADGPTQPPPDNWRPVDGFAWPAEGPITSRFGWRISPIDNQPRQHTGIDIGIPAGTPVRASRDGVVIKARYDTVYGIVVMIDHGGQYATLYAHHTSLAVVEGQRVTQGQVIGYAGSTGYVSGPHLHFEIPFQGTSVDPLLLLGR